MNNRGVTAGVDAQTNSLLQEQQQQQQPQQQSQPSLEPASEATAVTYESEQSSSSALFLLQQQQQQQQSDQSVLSAASVLTGRTDRINSINSNDIISRSRAQSYTQHSSIHQEPANTAQTSVESKPTGSVLQTPGSQQQPSHGVTGAGWKSSHGGVAPQQSLTRTNQHHQQQHQQHQHKNQHQGHQHNQYLPEDQQQSFQSTINNSSNPNNSGGVVENHSGWPSSSSPLSSTTASNIRIQRQQSGHSSHMHQSQHDSTSPPTASASTSTSTSTSTHSGKPMMPSPRPSSTMLHPQHHITQTPSSVPMMATAVGGPQAIPPPTPQPQIHLPAPQLQHQNQYRSIPSHQSQSQSQSQPQLPSPPTTTYHPSTQPQHQPSAQPQQPQSYLNPDSNEEVFATIYERADSIIQGIRQLNGSNSDFSPQELLANAQQLLSIFDQMLKKPAPGNQSNFGARQVPPPPAPANDEVGGGHINMSPSGSYVHPQQQQQQQYQTPYPTQSRWQPSYNVQHSQQQQQQQQHQHQQGSNIPSSPNSFEDGNVGRYDHPYQQSNTRAPPPQYQQPHQHPQQPHQHPQQQQQQQHHRLSDAPQYGYPQPINSQYQSSVSHQAYSKQRHYTFSAGDYSDPNNQLHSPVAAITKTEYHRVPSHESVSSSEAPLAHCP